MKSKHLSMQGMISLLMVIVGNFIYALAVKLFLIPGGLITGGTTGIALAVNYLSGFSVSTFVLIFNICMLVVGALLLGKAFAATTIISTFTYPIALKLLDYLLGNLVLTNDILLCTVFSGIGIGISLGVVIRAGASTGGMDIPPLVLNRYFKLPVSVGLYLFDFIILLGQAYFQPIDRLLYGIILVMIYTIVLDKLLLLGSTRTEIKLISKQSEAICNAILKQMDRGATLLSGKGAYLHQDTDVVFSVVSNRELPKIEKIVHSIDPECFMVVTRVSEVKGRGFSMKKKYTD